MFIALILSFAVFSYTSASPIQTAEVHVAAELPAIEEENLNRTTWITNYYVPTPGVGTHKFHATVRKNWNDARVTCLNEGAHLVVINSAAEQAVITKILVDHKNNDDLWIGVHEQFKKDDWVSVKDERLDAIGYINWRQGEPNNLGDEHCLATNQVGVNDQNCNNPLFFICEK